MPLSWYRGHPPLKAGPARRACRPSLQVLEDRCTPATAFALSGNNLLAFDTANPSAALAPISISGLNVGDTLVGIDFRPQNGHLYGLGFNSGAGTVQLYQISHRNGVATTIG